MSQCPGHCLSCRLPIAPRKRASFLVPRAQTTAHQQNQNDPRPKVVRANNQLLAALVIKTLAAVITMHQGGIKNTQSERTQPLRKGADATIVSLKKRCNNSSASSALCC
jgi:hypothetical protein